jgi:transcriptional regulator with XRE-family HTH domain
MQQQDLKAIGSRVKTIRKDEGLRQQDLADEAGLNIKTISFVENGHTTPPQELLELLSNKYGFSIDWILAGGSKEKKSKGEMDSPANVHAKVHKLEIELKEIKNLMKEILTKLDGGNSANT